ncbi:MAG: 2'-5' RNA ligase family protein [Dermatophilaceae bacterium]
MDVAPDSWPGPLGVSIPIPDPYGGFLQGKRSEYRDPLAATTVAHVTLLGPTKVTDEGLPDLLTHLQDAAAGALPFRMVLRGTGTFRPVSPVVFVQVAEGISSCEQLERAIRSGEYDHGADFPYHPHVTVAHNVSEERLDRAFEELADFTARFVVREFWMYQRDDAGVWQPRHRFPLGSREIGA